MKRSDRLTFGLSSFVLGAVLAAPFVALADFGGAQGGGGGGGLSTVSTTGDGLSGDGSAGDPLAVASDLENLVDTLSVSSGGQLSWATGLGTVVEHIKGPSDQPLLIAPGANQVTQLVDKNGTAQITITETGITLSSEISESYLSNGNDGEVLTSNSGSVVWAAPAGLTIESNATSNTITAAEATFAGYVFTDDGTDNNNTSANELPACAAGLVVRGYCRQGDADDILALTAVGDDTIRVGGSVTAAAGTVHLKETGSSVTLLGINSTEWVSLGGEGNVYFP